MTRPGEFGDCDVPRVARSRYWSRRPLKEPCPCPSVIPKSSAARCSNGGRLPLAACRPIAQMIDTGQLPGLNRAEQAELAAANKRIHELETEVAILKRARELLGEPHDAKGGTRP